MPIVGWSGKDVAIIIIPKLTKGHIPPLRSPAHGTRFADAKLAQVAELPSVFINLPLAVKVRGLGRKTPSHRDAPRAAPYRPR